MNIIDEEFFKKLRKEFVPIIQSLSAEQTLQNTEKRITTKLEEWNNKPAGLAQDQTVRNLCSIVMSFILLYRQRYFNELGRNPSNFIMEFLKSIIPESLLTNKDKHNLEKNILSLLSNVTPSEWAKIACPINPQITVLVWDKISDSNDNTVISLINAMKDEEDEFYSIEGELSSGTYEEYKSKIDEKLQSQIRQPDLILIDSILLAEYKSKGALYTAGYYIPENIQTDITAKKLPEIEIGKTVNGNIEAIPITRNFHVAGHGHSFIDEKIRKALKDEEIILSEIIQINGITSQGIVPEWKSYLKLNKLLPYSLPGPPSFIGSEIKTQDDLNNIENIDGQFVTSMGDEIPFIPMQAARGAHITYTFFAYLSGVSKDDYSFISVTKDNAEEKEKLCINIYSEELIRARIKCFLRLIYLYVPVISLCFDHVRAGVVRSSALRNVWFDPCLPIEAQKFQEDKICLSNNPAKVRLNDASLSCLGGYCLALTHSSNAKHQAVKQGFRLAKKYYNDVNKQNPPSDFNCRIDYSGNASKNPQAGYICTPQNIAKRPNFHGWGVIEEQISNIVRQYMATVMIIRALISECSLEKEGLKYINNIYQFYDISNINVCNDSVNNITEFVKKDVVSETFIKIYLSRAKEMIEKFFLSLEKNNFSNKSIKYETEQKTKKWVSSNFDDLIEDRNAILGLLLSAIKRIDSSGQILEVIIAYLAERMSETLVNKLEALCHNAEWKVNHIKR